MIAAIGHEMAAARLFRSTRTWLEALDEPVLRPFVDPLAQAEASRELEASGLPVLAWLEALGAAASDRTAGLVSEFVEAAPDLCWNQTYAAADFGPEFLERYGWTELAGQRGPFGSNEVAAGFLMLGPNTHYPPHRHVAEEDYIVLAGTASWSRDGAIRVHRPGTLIHHPSMIWHGVATRGEPLLAFYLWRGGDLTQKSEIEAARTYA